MKTPIFRSTRLSIFRDCFIVINNIESDSSSFILLPLIGVVFFFKFGYWRSMISMQQTTKVRWSVEPESTYKLVFFFFKIQLPAIICSMSIHKYNKHYIDLKYRYLVSSCDIDKIWVTFNRFVVFWLIEIVFFCWIEIGIRFEECENTSECLFS